MTRSQLVQAIEGAEFAKRDWNNHTASDHCNGYLDHPFKNRHVETEKEILSLLANTGGLVYNQTSSSAYSCSNDDTLT